MKKLLRLFTVTAVLFVTLVFNSINVFAVDSWDYYCDVVITDTSGTNRTGVPVILGINTGNLQTQGYIDSDGLNVRAKEGSSEVPVFVRNDNIHVTLPVLLSNQSRTIRLYFKYSPDLTTFDIITGYGGYVTTTDDAALEPGADFTLETPGYFDTNYTGTIKTHYYKTGSLKLITMADDTLTAVIDSNNAVIAQAAQTGTIGFETGWQTFTTGANGCYLSRIRLSKSATTGTPDGYLNVETTNAGSPTGVVVATSSDGYDSSGIWFDFPLTYLEANTQYAFRGVGFNGANRWTIYYANNDPYADGRYSSNASYDLMFNVYESPFATVTSVSSGELDTVTVEHTGTEFSLTVDTDTETISTTTAVPNTANNFIFMSNSATSLSSISLTVSGTEVLNYAPITTISGTALPDRAGAAQNGVITYGANVDTTVSAGVIYAYNDNTAEVDLVTTSDTVPEVDQPDGWYSHVGGITNLPGYEILSSNLAGIAFPTLTAYFWIGIMLSIITLVGVYSFTHYMPIAILGELVVVYFFYDANVFPGVVFGLAIVINLLVLYLVPQN